MEMALSAAIGYGLGQLSPAAFISKLKNTDLRGPVSAAILFPAWLLFRVRNLMVFGGVAVVGGLIIYKHKDNFVRNRKGDEMHVSDFAEKYEELHHI